MRQLEKKRPQSEKGEPARTFEEVGKAGRRRVGLEYILGSVLEFGFAESKTFKVKDYNHQRTNLFRVELSSQVKKEDLFEFVIDFLSGSDIEKFSSNSPEVIEAIREACKAGLVRINFEKRLDNNPLQ